MGVFTRFIGLQSVLLASFMLSLTIPYGYAAEQEAYSKVHEGVAKLGKQWNGEVNVATTDLFIELHNVSDRSGVTLVSDISYGSHQLQVMDIVTPESESEELLPVVVFFNGGALIRGNKAVSYKHMTLPKTPYV